MNFALVPPPADLPVRAIDLGSADGVRAEELSAGWNRPGDGGTRGDPRGPKVKGC